MFYRYDIEVNKKDNTGYTALHWAADLGRERVVRALLSHEHTDADAQDEVWRTFSYSYLS